MPQAPQQTHTYTKLYIVKIKITKRTYHTYYRKFSENYDLASNQVSMPDLSTHLHTI